MSTAPTFWIEARASGLLAYLLLTASVLAGLLLKSRPFGTTPKPAAVTDAHRFLAVSCLVATAVHGVALVLDRTIHIGIVDLLVPGTLSYRPVWTGIGVAAADLLLVVYVSFSQRKRIGARRWRQLHWSTYPLFVAFTLHGVMSGSDTAQAWVRAVYAVCLAFVAGATVWRAFVPPPKPTPRTRRVDPAAVG